MCLSYTHCASIGYEDIIICNILQDNIFTDNRIDMLARRFGFFVLLKTDFCPVCDLKKRQCSIDENKTVVPFRRVQNL